MGQEMSSLTRVFIRQKILFRFSYFGNVGVLELYFRLSLILTSFFMLDIPRQPTLLAVIRTARTE